MISSVLLRKAKQHEGPDIRLMGEEKERRAFSHLSKWISEAIKERTGVVYVAEDKGVIVGAAYGDTLANAYKKRAKKFSRYAAVAVVIVAEKYRRSGIGSALVSKLLNDYRKYEKIIAEPETVGSEKMLRALGFTDVPDEILEQITHKPYNLLWIEGSSYHQKTAKRILRLAQRLLFAGYYEINPKKPPSIKEVVAKWVNGDRANDEDKQPDGMYYHAKYPIIDLTRITAGNPLRYGPGSDEYATLKSRIEKEGFRQPLVILVGRNGATKIGEGNHRLAVAGDLGLEELPVRFDFRQRV